MSAETLLPCPFCGAAARVTGDDGASVDGRGTWWGRCPECGADGSAHDWKHEAIAAWNRRATQPTPSTTVERERLAKMCDAHVATCEDSAETWRRAQDDRRAPGYAEKYDRLAADWRTIAAILRTPPVEQGEPTENV